MKSEHIYIGGLFRCCTMSLEKERSQDEKPAIEGQVHECEYCSNTMIFKNNAWRWAGQ